MYLKICKGHFLELFYGGENDRDYALDFKKTGYNHLCLETDNLLADVERLRTLGVQIDQEPKTSADKNWFVLLTNKQEITMLVTCQTRLSSSQARTSALTTDPAFWKGCTTCPHYHTLLDNNGQDCECQGLLFNPVSGKDITS